MSDVAVIGGGIIGAVTAYELARSGAKVELYDKATAGAQQSGRNWGFVRQQGRNSAEMPLMRSAIRRWCSLEDELDADLGWRQGGCLTLAPDEAMLGRLRAWIPLGAEFGAQSTVLSPDEVQDVVPGLAVPVVGGLFCAEDGHAEPLATTRAFVRAAERAGATIHEGAQVTGITTRSGRVTGVQTADGLTRRADVVVCAAGADSRRLLQGIGVDLPQSFVFNTVACTSVLPPITAAGVWAPGLAFRQRPDGTVLFAAGPGGDLHIGLDSMKVAPWFMSSFWRNKKHLRPRVGRRLLHQLGDKLTPNATVDDYDDRSLPNLRRVRLAQRRLQAAFPHLRTIPVSASWGGVVDVTPDATPVIDLVPTVEGLVISTGYSGHGFGLGVPAGEATAALAAGDRPSYDLQRFRFTRFEEADFQPADGIL